MSFVHPVFLWAFTLLLIPIIVHLFHFKRYKTLYFSSILFLKSVSEESKSTQKLKHLLVLFARLLAFSALILAFAQPYLPDTLNQAKGKQSVMAFYLDNSYSMSAAGTSGNLLQQGKEVIRNLSEKAPLSTNFMLVTNLMSSSELRVLSKNELRDKLDEIDFIPLPQNIGVPLKGISNYLNEEQQNASHQFVILSDFQKNTADFEDWKADSAHHFYPIQLTPQNSGNLFIDSVWFENPIRKINRSNQLFVRIINQYQEALTNVPVALNVGNINRRIMVDLPAQSSVTTSFTYSDTKIGITKGIVELNDDQVFFDDVYYFSYEVKEKSEVLIVADESISKNASAVERVFNTDDFYNVTVKKVNQLTLDDVRNAQLVVLNGLNEISSGLQSMMMDYVANGGGLFIIPGEKIVLANYNELLGKLSMPLMQQLTNNNYKINSINYADVFFDGVFEQKPNKVNLPLLSAYYNNYSANINDIALLSIENETTIFSRSSGDKHVFVLYTGLSDAFGNFSNHGIFSTILLRSAERSGNTEGIYAELGSSEPVPIQLPSAQEGAIHLIQKDFDLIPPTFRQGNKAYVSLDETTLLTQLNAGFYNVVWRDQFLGTLALNYNRQESYLAALLPQEIIARFEQSGARHIHAKQLSDGTNFEQLSLDNASEYWRILLILSLLFLTIEMLLTKFFKT